MSAHLRSTDAAHAGPVRHGFAAHTHTSDLPCIPASGARGAARACLATSRPPWWWTEERKKEKKKKLLHHSTMPRPEYIIEHMEVEEPDAPAKFPPWALLEYVPC